ncbi:MAG: MFS transporter [Defluviitaleaceae bacterium]|nr:MFS transporter [Defluviitaleaceae bacterium]
MNKLWNRDFTLLMFVQVLALFANTSLSFVLPLYILDISESPALFGTVLALAGVPLILMTPIGGVFADRGKKKWIIFWMDVSTTMVIVLFMLLNGFFASVVPIVIVKLFALNVIQGVYMPTAMASIRFLAPKEKLVPANAIGGMIFSLANATGPAIGTVLYANFGLFPILMGCAVIFAIVSILDLFLRIPHKLTEKRHNHISPNAEPEMHLEARYNLLQIIKNDFATCIKFGTKEKPIIAKLIIILFLASVPSVAMFIVGLPVLITQTLALDMQLLAISQVVVMGGGLLGGILVGALEKHLTISKAHWLLVACTIATLIAALAFLTIEPAILTFILVTIAGSVIMLTTQIVFVQVIAYAQIVSPKEIVGKVTAVLMAIALAAYPVGQLLFGMLFEELEYFPWLVLLIATVMTAAVTIYSRNHFKNT